MSFYLKITKENISHNKNHCNRLDFIHIWSMTNKVLLREKLSPLKNLRCFSTKWQFK